MVKPMTFDHGRYPAARRLDLVEDLFGHQVADPYRWLEDPGSDETRNWLDAEDALWARYRDGLPHRRRFADRVRELLEVGSVGTPVWRGTRCFRTRRDPGQEHAVLYVAGAGDVAPVIPSVRVPFWVLVIGFAAARSCCRVAGKAHRKD